jgi:resuscitation-promoting factor RpfA
VGVTPFPYQDWLIQARPAIEGQGTRSAYGSTCGSAPTGWGPTPAGRGADGGDKSVCLACLMKRRSLAVAALVVLMALVSRPAAYAAYASYGAGHARVWDDLAMCESSGNWNTDTGNGFFGGLQFWHPTWLEFGGLEYAPRADLATPEQQIAIAEEVLREQGWGAWPECARKLGLSGRWHTVQPGDTLETVADDFGVAGGAPELYALNRFRTGPNPQTRLTPGTMLRLP